MLVTHQLVFRFSPVLGLMGSHDGPLGLRHPPNIDAAFAFHCRLLRIDCAYPLFKSWCKILIPYLTFYSPANLERHVASQQNPNSDIRHRTIGMLDLVSGQLLPHGFKWSSTRYYIWSTARGGLDDGVDVAAIRVAFPHSLAFPIFVFIHKGLEQTPNSDTFVCPHAIHHVTRFPSRWQLGEEPCALRVRHNLKETMS